MERLSIENKRSKQNFEALFLAQNAYVSSEFFEVNTLPHFMLNLIETVKPNLFGPRSLVPEDGAV